MPVKRRDKRRVLHIEQFRRNGFINRINTRFLIHRDFSRFVLINNCTPARQPCCSDLIIHGDGRLGQIIKQGFKTVVKKRQPMFHTLMFAPRADRFVKGIIRARRTKFDPVILTKPTNGRIIQNHLGHRGEFNQLKLFRRALCGNIKAPRPIQNIAKQIQAHRRCVTRWEYVNDPAANGVIARLHHGWCLRKTHPHKEITQCSLIHTPPDLGAKRGLFQNVTRRNALRGGIQSGQQNKVFGHVMDQCGQCCHTRRRDIRIRRQAIIG